MKIDYLFQQYKLIIVYLILYLSSIFQQDHQNQLFKIVFVNNYYKLHFDIEGQMINPDYYGHQFQKNKNPTPKRHLILQNRPNWRRQVWKYGEQIGYDNTISISKNSNVPCQRGLIKTTAAKGYPKRQYSNSKDKFCHSHQYKLTFSQQNSHNLATYRVPISTKQSNIDNSKTFKSRLDDQPSRLYNKTPNKQLYLNKCKNAGAINCDPKLAYSTDNKSPQVKHKNIYEFTFSLDSTQPENSQNQLKIEEKKYNPPIQEQSKNQFVTSLRKKIIERQISVKEIVYRDYIRSSSKQSNQQNKSRLKNRMKETLNEIYQLKKLIKN